jgi:two-component system, chemotaxis family, protein-glutamate methylesterase/glutaminase
MNTRIRVLVVDDSAFARKVLREVLGSAPDIELVGIARDGLEALEKAAELRPDVMTLDLVMPSVDGLGVLDGLDPEHGPRVLIVSTASVDSELALSALERGAVDIVSKPTSLATDRLYELRDELIMKVRMAAAVRRSRLVAAAARPQRSPTVTTTRTMLVIGTSTGGPQALTRLLTALPGDFPLPIAVALHIPEGYTSALAKRIHDGAALEVVEAHEGLALQPGRAVIARGGSHLRVTMLDGTPRCTLSRVPADSLYFPSVDVLFGSAADHLGRGVVGLVLTGMGDDGSRGAARIREAGGLVFTESASSCIVYGMPRCVAEQGNSDGEAPLDGLSALLLARL